jgi:oligopeptide transport system substrate-binding protein
MLGKRHGWRAVLLAAVTLAALAAAAACGGGEEEEGPTATAGPAETPQATQPAGERERRQGGELTVHGFEFQSLDPHFSSFAQDISLHRMIWRGLYMLDKNNVPQPMMAADMPEISEDGTTYTIKLKEGLKWSDGEPLTAADFEYGIKRTCNPENAGEYQYVLTNLVGCDAHFNNEAGFDQALEDAIGVKALDETTLEVRLQQAQPTFTIILSLWMTFPAPKHLFQTTSDPWPTDPSKLAYNGPYILQEYVQQDHVTLVPNPNWVGEIKPTLDKLTIRFIDDAAVAVNAYRAGELDESEVDTTQLRSIAQEFPGEYLKTLQPSTRGLEMQLKDPTLANKEVRLALARAIDRERLNEVVVQGANEPTTSWIPEVTSGVPLGTYDDIIGFNPEAARQHLANAGYPNGQGFPKLSILVGDSPAARATAEFLQQNFKEVLNIDTDIEVVDSATRSSRFTNEQFQLFPGGWIQDYPDPENWILGLFDTNGTLNNYNCSMPEIDDLVAKARFNTNNEERLQQYRQIERLIIENVCGIAPYWHENNHWLVKPYVVGMRENTSGQDGVQPGDWIAEAWGLAAE